MSPKATAAVIAGLTALYGAMLFLGDGAGDRLVLAWFRTAEPSISATAARWWTQLGGFAVLLPVSLILALAGWRRCRDWRAPACYLLMTLSGRLLVELQKGLFLRLRPNWDGSTPADYSYAFPSGHSANAMMVWIGAALFLAPRSRPAIAAAAALALSIGLTRPVLGVHWPSDVVGGWAFGLFWVLLWLRLSGTGRKDCSPASV